MPAPPPGPRRHSPWQGVGRAQGSGLQPLPARSVAPEQGPRPSPRKNGWAGGGRGLSSLARRGTRGSPDFEAVTGDVYQAPLTRPARLQEPAARAFWNLGSSSAAVPSPRPLWTNENAAQTHPLVAP